MDNDVTKNGQEGTEPEVKTGLNFEIAEGEELSISEAQEHSTEMPVAEEDVEDIADIEEPEAPKNEKKNNAVEDEFTIPDGVFEAARSESFVGFDDGYSIRTTYMPRFTEVSENYRMAGERRKPVTVESAPVQSAPVATQEEKPAQTVAPTSEEVDQVEVEHVVVTRAPIEENEPKDESVRFFKFDGDGANLPEREQQPKREPEPEQAQTVEEEPEQIVAEEPAPAPKVLRDPSEYDIPDPAVRVRESEDGAKRVSDAPSSKLPEGVEPIASEYISTSLRDKVKDRFLDKLMSAKVRLVSAALFLLAAIALELTPLFELDLLSLLGISGAGSRATVALCISVAAAFVSLPELIRAVGYLFKRRVHPELSLILGILVVVGYSAVTILSGESDYPTFASLYCLGCFLAVRATVCRVGADFRGFKIISAKEPYKYVIDKSFTRDLPRENIALDGAVDEYTSTTARMFKAGFVSDFLTRCEISAESSVNNLIMLILGISMSVVVGIVCYFISDYSLLASLCGATVMLLLSTPAVSVLSHKLAYDRAGKLGERDGGAFAGESALCSISEVDVITYRDCEIFGKEDVSLKKVHLYGQGENMDKAVRQMCALFTVVGGPLEAYFTASLGRRGAEASDVVLENNGVCGSFEGHTICAGSEDYMRAKGVYIPEGGSGAGSVGADSTRIMYGAEDGKVYVKFYIRYSFSEEFSMLMPYYKSKHIVPLIYTKDPNLSCEFMKTLTLGEDLIRVVKSTDTRESEHPIYRKISAEAATLGERLSAVSLILLAKKHASLRQALSVAELCAMGAGLALGAVMGVLLCFEQSALLLSLAALLPFGVQAVFALALYIATRTAFRRKRSGANH